MPDTLALAEPAQPSLGKTERLFADSLAAVAYARERGVPAGAEIVSCSPAVIEGCGARALEAGVSAGDIAALSAAVDGLGHALFDRLRGDPRLREYALTVARMAPPFEIVAYKAVLAHRGGLDRPFVVAAPEGSAPGPLPALLAGHAQLVAALRVPRARMPAAPKRGLRPPGLATRLRFETRQSIGFRVMSGLARAMGGLLGRPVLIPSVNSLIKETAYHLFFAGVPPLIAPPPPAGAGAAALPELERAAAEPVRAALAPFMDAWLAERAARAFVEQAAAAVAAYRSAAEHWRAVFARMKGGRPRAVLNNVGHKPAGEALFALCRERGVPNIAFQHGTGFEFSTMLDGIDYIGEAASADRFIAFSREAAAQAGAGRYAAGPAIAVGQPRDQIDGVRRRVFRRSLPPICYVSSQCFIADTMRPSNMGISDLEAVRWEREVVDQLLAPLPHRVLFKPYPAAFGYPDGNPAHAHAKACANIEFFDQPIDLRYLLGATRVVVASHTGSTINWCLMADRPLLYLDAPEQSRLRPAVREQFKAGLFWFDWSEPAERARARALLSQPLDAIERAWREKAEARRALIERWFGATHGDAGRRAARIVLDLIRGR